MTKLHVVIRSCDRVSVSSDRIVPKQDCIFRCINSLTRSLENQQRINYTLHIIDDRSSPETIETLKKIAPQATFNFLGERDDSHLDNREKSRYSVGVAYEYIYSLPPTDLVYIVEDDYLHYPDSIEKMIEAWWWFNSFIVRSVGIFPQDFRQLYPHPDHPFNDTYVAPCHVIPGPDRYYRSTWYTHESFMIPVHVILKYKNWFDSLLKIGRTPEYWEGNTISNVWRSPDVMMLMPMRALAIHVSRKDDIPFYNNDFNSLWQANNISLL